MFDDRVEHTGKADVEAVNRLAVGFERDIDAWNIFTDDAEIGRVGQGHRCRTIAGIRGDAGEFTEGFEGLRAVDDDRAVDGAALAR